MKYAPAQRPSSALACCKDPPLPLAPQNSASMRSKDTASITPASARPPCAVSWLRRGGGVGTGGGAAGATGGGAARRAPRAPRRAAPRRRTAGRPAPPPEPSAGCRASPSPTTRRRCHPPPPRRGGGASKASTASAPSASAPPATAPKEQPRGVALGGGEPGRVLDGEGWGAGTRGERSSLPSTSEPLIGRPGAAAGGRIEDPGGLAARQPARAARRQPCHFFCSLLARRDRCL